jgi:hypothetical protein
MKRLAMILAVAFTMGLAASTVTAATKDTKKKETTECTAKAGDKKACCSKDAKACCAAAKTEKPTEKTK